MGRGTRGDTASRPSAIGIEIALVVAAAALLWLSSLSSYLLFHSIIEAAFIAVGVAVFVMAWGLRSVTPSGYGVVVGTGLVFASALALLHLLSYKGMGVFPNATADLPTQLWIAARYVLAATFVIAPFYFARNPRVWAVSAVYALVVSVLVASIFWWRIFPTCYVEPTGLTDFKKVSEYVIAAAFILAAVLVARRGTDLSAVSRRLLVAAMLTSAAAEILFTLYVGVYAFPNMLGHLLMFVSVYLIYRGVVVSGLARTYKQVVEELDERTAELEALSRSLELRIEERTAALNVAVAELETISYSVSHELRSPLRAIDGFSLLALEEGRDTLDPQTVQGLERVRAAAQHMGHLIDDLLDIMKISSLQANREHIDLSSLAAAIAADVAAAHPDQRVRLGVEPQMIARADPTLVAIVMRNLLSNAYKFTSRSEDPAVTVSSEPGPGPTRYIVRDNGVGLDVEQAGKVFEPFHRLVRQDEFEGTGVGLAIVRRIILLHGGRIGIDGDLGQGATVWFTLEPDEAPAGQRSAISSETVTQR